MLSLLRLLPRPGQTRAGAAVGTAPPEGRELLDELFDAAWRELVPRLPSTNPPLAEGAVRLRPCAGSGLEALVLGLADPEEECRAAASVRPGYGGGEGPPS